MPGIGFVDKTYAKNRLCRPKVDLICQSVKPGVFRTKNNFCDIFSYFSTCGSSLEASQ